MRFTAVRWLFASALGFASAVFASGPEILYFGGGRQAAAGDESMRGRVLRATEVTSDFIDRDPRHRVALADIDGDGRLDAAVSNPEKGTINILLSNGTSRSYGRQMDFPAIALLDLNGDEKLDLIAVDHESIVIRPGNGDGTFGEPRIADSCGRFVAPAAISAADFNRDGWIDLVIADVRPNRLVMLMGSSDGTFRSSTEYRLIVTPASLSVGDFDADGWPDVAFANENDRAVGVLLRSEFANHDCPTASPQDRARLPITVNATQTIFIGFDQDAAGSDIPNLSLIDEQYAALGVHFNATFYAARRALAFPSYSANFSLNYLCTFFGTAGGDRPCIEPIGGGAAVLVADIDFPIEFASIEGYTRNDGEFDRDGLIIDAYGAGGNFLAEGSDFRSNDPPPYTREGILRAAVSASGIRRSSSIRSIPTLSIPSHCDSTATILLSRTLNR
ncbi:MAG TPA: VCBS repeat-containing protein [Thermoanaerobaculia bacterium]